MSISRELRFLLKFDIFNCAVQLPHLSTMFETITVDPGNAAWVKCFSVLTCHKRFYSMAWGMSFMHLFVKQ